MTKDPIETPHATSRSAGGKPECAIPRPTAPPARTRTKADPPANAEEARLIVFVGRKISVTFVPSDPPPNVILLDAEFTARYEVLELVFGDYTGKEIEFSVFDHYGRPNFAQYDVVQLYVSRYDNKLVHNKYLFQPVYRTADGRWAGCGDPYQGMHSAHRRNVQTVPIAFDPPVVFSMEDAFADLDPNPCLHPMHPGSYCFRASDAPSWPASPPADLLRCGDRLHCVRGAYPDQLFRVMREGILKSRAEH